MFTLYLVATPIGNLEDISPRALEVLASVTLVAAEDTRTARHLLEHFNIHTPVTSYFEHSRPGKLDRIMDALGRGDVAVISEAGMPGINDPGYELVKAALEHGARVSPVPGPSAVLAALVASGLPAGSFYYLGFLPREPRVRRRLIREVAHEPLTLVAFETPHRLRAALEDLEAGLGAERPVAVARELTKKFEEFQRGSLAEVRAHFAAHEPRGEFTLVIGGATGQRRARPTTVTAWDADRVRAEFAARMKQGLPRSEAVRQIARASGLERREVYALTLKSKLGEGARRKWNG